MKNIIIVALVLLVSGVTIAQNSLFTNISTTDQYQGFSFFSSDGDGTYTAKDKDPLVTFTIANLPTGEPSLINIIQADGDEKGKKISSFSTIAEYSICTGYPYESFIASNGYNKKAIVSIGDYVFVLGPIGKDGVSFKGIQKAYVKKGIAKNVEGAKKKKLSFKEKLKALKNKAAGSYGPEHKALQSLNLDKMITDYLVAMKVKQDARTPAQKQVDIKVKNIRENKTKNDIAETKKYNDSIIATPAHQRMLQHRRDMDTMEKNNPSKVTIKNAGSKRIGVCSGSTAGTTYIASGSSDDLDCNMDYYKTYLSSSNTVTKGTKIYSAKSKCGGTITVQ